MSDDIDYTDFDKYYEDKISESDEKHENKKSILTSVSGILKPLSF
jgi:hypothetical protein